MQKKYNLIRIILLTAYVFVAFGSHAQLHCDWYRKDKPHHLLKTNLLGLATGTYNLEYERSFRPNTSLGINVSYTPTRHLPFRDRITQNMENPNAVETVKNATFNHFSITPQARFYFGDRALFTRFYVSPYLKYSNYNGDFTFHYQYVDETGITVATTHVPIDLTIQTVSAGIAFGLQFNLFRALYLDWKILGTHYGILLGSGNGRSSAPLTADIQQTIKNDIESINDFPTYSSESHVTANDVSLSAKGLNIGLTTAISLGYRF